MKSFIYRQRPSFVIFILFMFFNGCGLSSSGTKANEDLPWTVEVWFYRRNITSDSHDLFLCPVRIKEWISTFFKLKFYLRAYGPLQIFVCSSFAIFRTSLKVRLLLSPVTPALFPWLVFHFIYYFFLFVWLEATKKKKTFFWCMSLMKYKLESFFVFFYFCLCCVCTSKHRQQQRCATFPEALSRCRKSNLFWCLHGMEN